MDKNMELAFKRNKLIKTLYERCEQGEISVAQREALIQKTNSMFIAQELAKGTITKDDVSYFEFPKLPPYEAFKESAYQKCAKGEITLEQREELLLKARDKFFTIPE